ncbi:GntR family transcriptional regulator, partial [Paenibacillus agaridevorans]
MKKNNPLYINVANFVKEQIRTQKLNPGEKIYEEELQKQFNVSHITTKKALSVLVDQNLIVRVPGRGTFVTSDIELGQDDANPATTPTIVFLLPLTEKGINVFTN